MMIPYKFTLGNQHWSVHRGPSILGGKLGKVFYDLQAIKIATHHKRKPRDAPAQAEAFWHEVTHAILHNMGCAHLAGNEAFVTAFSTRLNQVIHTAELTL